MFHLSPRHHFLLTLSIVIIFGFGSYYFFSHFREAEPAVSIDQGILVLRDTEHYVSYVPEAQYTIVEYFDFDCVFCRRLHMQAAKESIDYSKVNYIIRSYPATDPLLSSQKSLMAECVYAQMGNAGYLQFIEAYYKQWGNQKKLDWSLEIAKGLVSNEEELTTCINDNTAMKDMLSSHYFQDSVAGISSTPTFMVYKDGVFEEKYVGLNLKLYLSLISYYSKQ